MGNDTLSANLYNRRLTWPNGLFWSGLIVGNSLLLTPEGSLTRTAGAMIVLLWPGLAWAESLALATSPLLRWLVGLGLSYAFIVVLGLLLHYLPGSIPLWSGLIVFNALSLSVWIRGGLVTSIDENDRLLGFGSRAVFILFLVIILTGAIFRFVNLGYSEFDGDEVKALTPAAEAIEGRAEALFYQRSKGPAEILLPMMLWRFTGVTDELKARLLFALAGVLTIMTTYVVSESLFNPKVGLIAAGLMALNGFMVAFARIVQYQQIVVWMSLLSLLCIWFWRKQGQTHWGILAALFFGTGLLAHYDVVLVAPALLYLLGVKPRFKPANVAAWLAAGLSLFVVAGLFFGPYALNLQATRTTSYLGQRVVGSELVKNKLADFLHVSIFYNSFYYVLIIGLLALAFLAWAVANIPSLKRLLYGRAVGVIVVVISVLGLSLWPDALNRFGLDWAFLPFTLVLLAVFLSPVVTLPQRVIVVWFATAFLGYNFLVSTPRTHFYTIFPPLIVLAALSMAWLWSRLIGLARYWRVGGALALTILFGGYLYQAYLRPEVEFETDWPDSQLALYWSPYTSIPALDAYGFMHHHGWKTIGGLYVSDQLKGDYETNAMHSKTNWYTRYAIGSGCYGQTRYFFGLKHMAINPAELANYDQIGTISLPTGKGLNIYQLQPVSAKPDSFDIKTLNHLFDRTARSSAFVRPAAEAHSTQVNLADAIRLIGYEITVPTARPGQPIAVTLDWEAQKSIPLNLNVFVHLESSQNPASIWGQSDGSPACGDFPTSTWQAGQIVQDSHVLLIKPDTPPGTYKLTAGMYLPGDNRRAPVLDETGQPIADSIELTTLTIQ